MLCSSVVCEDMLVDAPQNGLGVHRNGWFMSHNVIGFIIVNGAIFANTCLEYCI